MERRIFRIRDLFILLLYVLIFPFFAIWKISGNFITGLLFTILLIGFLVIYIKLKLVKKAKTDEEEYYENLRNEVE